MNHIRETLRTALHPSDRQLLQFGWIALFGFPLLGVMLRWLWHVPAAVLWIAVALGIACAVCTALGWVAALRPVWRALALLALPIGLLLAPLLLALIYYGMFTPFALWFRIIGRDKLQLRIDRAAATYWVERTKPRTPASYLRLH